MTRIQQAILSTILCLCSMITASCEEPRFRRITGHIVASNKFTPADPVKIKDPRLVGQLGRHVPDQRIECDEVTRGLANVLVIGSANAFAQPTKREIVEHLIVAQQGNYFPRVTVMQQCDTVYFATTDRFSYSTLIRGEVDGPILPDYQQHSSAFRIERTLDKPIRIESANFPWMTAWIFCEKSTKCSVTDRLGAFVLYKAIPNRKIDLAIWHEAISSTNVRIKLEKSNEDVLCKDNHLSIKAGNNDIDIGVIMLEKD
jgi:hypothetical protein